MQPELRRQRRLDRRENDREVLRLAASHDGVDGRLFDGAFGIVRRNSADDRLGGSCRACQHRQDAFGRRRDNGQPVAPSAVVARLDRIGRRGNADTP
jgi:hypothetical protein